MSLRKTILVVDDDFDITDTLREILSDAGYEVASASNGREALDYLQAQPSPDIILLDLMMPHMNGTQFREEQLRDPRLAQIPVIMLTASPRPVPDPALAGWLGKPFDLDMLLATIERVGR